MFRWEAAADRPLGRWPWLQQTSLIENVRMNFMCGSIEVNQNLHRKVKESAASHFSSWVMVVPRKQTDSKAVTGFPGLMLYSHFVLNLANKLLDII